MRALLLALSLLLALAYAASTAPVIREPSGLHWFPDGVAAGFSPGTGQASIRNFNGVPGNGVIITMGYAGNSIVDGCLACTIAGGGTSGFENDITDPGGDYATISGGYDNQIGNSIASAIAGGAHHRISSTGGHSVIGGGSTNTISGAIAYGTIGGGQSNTASAQNATVSGGTTNQATATSATVGGGTTNTASNTQATVAGGGSNTASGSSATVGGGASNSAPATADTVAGGSSNSIAASNDYCTIGGGLSNSITGGGSGTYAVIAGGRSNTDATAQYSSIGGGQSNNVGAPYGTITGGFQGSVSQANWYGMECRASGQFAAVGDAQACKGTLRRQTTDATVTTLYLDGAGTGNRLRIPNDTAWTFSILVVSRRTDVDNESASYKFEGLIHNNANTTAFVGTPVKTVLAESTAAWDANVVATDGATDALEIQVTGEAAKTINWVAYAEIVMVTG